MPRTFAGIPLNSITIPLISASFYAVVSTVSGCNMLAVIRAMELGVFLDEYDRYGGDLFINHVTLIVGFSGTASYYLQAETSCLNDWPLMQSIMTSLSVPVFFRSLINLQNYVDNHIFANRGDINIEDLHIY